MSTPQVFGIPADFNLNVMQQIEDDPHIEWVGTGRPESTIHLRGQSADVEGQNFQAITLTDPDGMSRHPLLVKLIQLPVPATHTSGGP